MKKMIVMAAALLTINTVTRAQENKTPAATHVEAGQKKHRSPEERALKDAQRAQKDLGLDAAQTAKWQSASLERINANTPLKEQMRATTDKNERQKIAAQMRPNMFKFDETVNAFLTADQKTKWEQIKKEKKHKHRERNTMNPAPANTN